MSADDTVHQQAVIEMLGRRDRIRTEMGGAARMARLAADGVANARQHLDRILDPGSFVELGTFARSERPEDQADTPGDGKIGGTGTIDGRPVTVVSDDITVKRASSSATNHHKLHRMWESALHDGRPIVKFAATGGARIPDMLGSDGFVRIPPSLYQMERGRTVPLVTVIVGDSFGGSSFVSALSDFVIQRRGTCMAVTSPRVIELATSEVVTNDELGGPEVHAKVTGQIDLVVDDDEQAYAAVRRFLSYLPSNNWTRPPVVDPVEPEPADLEALVPERRRRGYDVHKVLDAIFDRDSVFELRPMIGRNLVTALARIDGRSVGVLASQPMQQGGALSPDSCDKAVRLICLCDAFGIPLVFLHDTPGFVVGTSVEHNKLLYKAMLLQQAVVLSTVPKYSIITRKSFGLACHVMSGPGTRADLVCAWPGAEISFMDPNVAANVVFVRELEGLTGEALRDATEALAHRVAENTDPYGAAGLMKIDEIIEPNDTRATLRCRVAQLGEPPDGSRRAAATGEVADLLVSGRRSAPTSERGHVAGIEVLLEPGDAIVDDGGDEARRHVDARPLRCRAAHDVLLDVAVRDDPAAQLVVRHVRQPLAEPVHHLQAVVGRLLDLVEVVPDHHVGRVDLTQRRLVQVVHRGVPLVGEPLDRLGGGHSANVSPPILRLPSVPAR